VKTGDEYREKKRKGAKKKKAVRIPKKGIGKTGPNPCLAKN